MTLAAVVDCGHTCCSDRHDPNWLRTGKITIRLDSNSQGNPRRFTQREVDAIRACLDQVDQARYVLAAFDAGRMFADAIAFGQPAKAAVNA